jgi:hypothetical protein
MWTQSHSTKNIKKNIRKVAESTTDVAGWLKTKLQMHLITQTVIKKSSGALVRQRTIPTERPPIVGEVIANFSG